MNDNEFVIWGFIDSGNAIVEEYYCRVVGSIEVIKWEISDILRIKFRILIKNNTGYPDKISSSIWNSWRLVQRSSNNDVIRSQILSAAHFKRHQSHNLYRLNFNSKCLKEVIAYELVSSVLGNNVESSLNESALRRDPADTSWLDLRIDVEIDWFFACYEDNLVRVWEYLDVQNSIWKDQVIGSNIQRAITSIEDSNKHFESLLKLDNKHKLSLMNIESKRRNLSIDLKRSELITESPISSQNHYMRAVENSHIDTRVNQGRITYSWPLIPDVQGRLSPCDLKGWCSQVHWPNLGSC